MRDDDDDDLMNRQFSSWVFATEANCNYNLN